VRAGAVEDAIERLADVRFVERRSGDRRKHPLGKRTADREPGGALLASPQPRRGGQLIREVYASTLMVLRRRQDATNEVSLHLHEAALPVEIALRRVEMSPGSRYFAH